jgi:hypothetical protein
VQKHDFNPVKNTQRLILFTARVDLALAESTRAAGSLTGIRTTAKASKKTSHSFCAQGVGRSGGKGLLGFSIGMDIAFSSDRESDRNAIRH